MKNNRPQGGWGPRPSTGRAHPAGPLSAPRAAILRLLTEQSAPCTVGALATAMHQHPNTVREHLDGLVASGLVDRTRAASRGRGRPAWLYAAVPAPATAPGAREYAGLSMALAAQIARTSSDPRADAVAAGREWGRALVRQSALGPVGTPEEARAGVVGLYDTLGFGPDPDPDAGDRVVRLRRCPLLEAAHRHPSVVCGVHLGMTRGAMEELGASPVEVDLVPFAEPGACLLRLGGAPAGPDGRPSPARRDAAR